MKIEYIRKKNGKHVLSRSDKIRVVLSNGDPYELVEDEVEGVLNVHNVSSDKKHIILSPGLLFVSIGLIKSSPNKFVVEAQSRINTNVRTIQRKAKDKK